MTDEEWWFVLQYLPLCREAAGRREHPLRDVFDAVRYVTSWTALTATGDSVDRYRDWVAAVPGSPNVLYTGGVSLYQSTYGGMT